MIIDAHHHFWKFNSEDFPWIDDSMAILKRDYLPVELGNQLQDSGVTGTIVVQARQRIEETHWLLELSEHNDWIKGVVGWVDLRSEDLPKQLDQLIPYRKFVGVRHVIQDEPDDNFMLRKDFLYGIEQLQKYDLCYDLLIYPRHLLMAARLAGMFPEQRFVLDHIAKPRIKERILDPWIDDIAVLADQPNVWCKISGMVTEADRLQWRYEDFVPFLDIVVKVFGTNRIMIGSDWPVCLLAAEYRDVMQIPARYFKGLDNNLQTKIFSANCTDFYKLSR
jgi:L-fuconolactonase